jgi:hypothetical protein
VSLWPEQFSCRHRSIREPILWGLPENPPLV